MRPVALAARTVLTVVVLIGCFLLPAPGLAGDEPGPGPEPAAPAAHKRAVCHVPPGNPAKARTLSLPEPAIAAHLRHGDYPGECRGTGEGTSERGKGKPKPAKTKGKTRGKTRSKDKTQAEESGAEQPPREPPATEAAPDSAAPRARHDADSPR